MYKYYLLCKLHWQNGLTYPVSFLMWRLRQFLATFTALSLWTVIFQSGQTVFGYSQPQMVSYIFLATVLQSLVLSTFLSGLSQDIYTGQISNLLVKPMKPLSVWISQEIADKMMNFSCVIVEMFILIIMFHPSLILPSLPTLAIFFIATLLGASLLFSIMLVFGMIGFWSPETWGPRFLFYLFLEFTAGKLFPLNILPRIIQQIIFWTPFPYLSYIQTQIFLGNLTGNEVTKALLCLLGWVIVTFGFSQYLWRKGLKEYGAVGR